jgi:chromosome segregation ATPase
MVVEATVPRPSRSGGLREQEAEIERLSRENFNLKLRVYYLEERLSQRDGNKSGNAGNRPAGSRGGASAGVSAAAADIEQECVELRVALAEERRSVREKDDLLRRAKESLATIREVSVADRKRAEDAAREQSGTSRELQDARNAAARAEQELAELARPLQSALSDLVTSAVLCQTAERRLAEMGSSSSRSALRGSRGGAPGETVAAFAPGLSPARGGPLSVAAETRERATQLRSSMERLAELATSARAAGNADAERLASLRSELRQAQDRAGEAEEEVAAVRAQLEATSAAAAAREARQGGRSAYGSAYGGVGRSSRVVEPPRLGGGAMSPDAAVLAAELERCVAELARERAARASLVRDAERHQEALRQKASGTSLQAERCASLERRCDELTERLAASERSAAQTRGGADTALRTARDAEAAAEERCSEALQRQREMSEEVARLSRRLAEAEVGWASATQIGEQAASDAARTKSQARQASAELFAARQEAALLREAGGEAKEREEASSRAREARTEARLRSARERLAAFRAALLGEGGVLSDASTAHPGKSGARSQWRDGAAPGGGGGRHHQGAEEEVGEEEAGDEAILRALAQLRPVMAWVREAVEAAQGRAERRVRDAESHIERLGGRLEATEMALAEATSRAARFRAAAAAHTGGGAGAGSEDLRAIEERSALLEEALQASATRGSALQESNRLLALELQEKAGRLQEVGRRGIAAAAAADALEGCIDRLGLIARETARIVSAALGPGVGSSDRRSEAVRGGVADLTRRVSSLASDTLEVLRQLTSPGE